MSNYDIELYELMLDENVSKMREFVNELNEASINIHNFRCDSILFQVEGLIEDTGENQLDPLMWVLWINSSLTDQINEI